MSNTALMSLDLTTAVNLSAIASVRFFGSNTELTADVQFLGCSKAGSELLQHFEGAAAQRLYEIINGGQGETSSSKIQPSEIDPTAALSMSPAFSKTKAWYHLTQTDGRRYILAFINAKGSCSMRTFSATNGQFIKRQYSKGNYQEEFAALIRNATELSVSFQPNLERDCKERLPEDVLAHLKAQS